MNFQGQDIILLKGHIKFSRITKNGTKTHVNFLGEAKCTRTHQNFQEIKTIKIKSYSKDHFKMFD